MTDQKKKQNKGTPLDGNHWVNEGKKHVRDLSTGKEGRNKNSFLVLRKGRGLAALICNIRKGLK
jgi:hypothetical protein